MRYLLLFIWLVPLVLTSQIDKPNEVALKRIKKNFSRINSVLNWDQIKEIDIEGESTEGGVAKYYYLDNTLEKIVATYYGEMGKVIFEYYLLDNKLSFIFKQEYNYPTPFDIENSKIIENRYYFENSKLIHQIPKTSDSLENNEELINQFEEELNRLNKKIVICQRL